MRDLNGNIPIIFGFHVRPFTSVQHLHLHVLVPPFKRFKQWKYDSRFCWFSTLEEVIGKLSIELKTKQRSQNELHHD
ncbi:hypothetical protein HMI56_004660 [Coelomomyces lativittatus]|nr:hypothetical protein HMI56_004660 [Coelomomyces lativittatus]